MLIEKLVIASRNPAKVNYYREVFADIAGEVIGLDSLDIDEKPEEAGETAGRNSQIKAMFYSTKTVFPVFCEDELLTV